VKPYWNSLTAIAAAIARIRRSINHRREENYYDARHDGQGGIMKITIIGAGNMGRGIATRALAGGHEVEIVDRDPAEARKLAQDLGDAATGLQPDSPFGGEVVIFAVYYPGIKDAVRQYADRLTGKVVVDITNPVDTQTWDRLATEPGRSSAEEIAQLVPQGTPVVKAFNTTFAGTLIDGEVGGQPLDVLIAGDDDAAKRKVSQLVSDGGLRPLDVGPLARAQQLEHLGLLHISLQQPHNLNFRSAIKLHRESGGA
jgi:8-hydroxy-5-deazaflavin:NADPH oxidoreductase